MGPFKQPIAAAKQPLWIILGLCPNKTILVLGLDSCSYRQALEKGNQAVPEENEEEHIKQAAKNILSVDAFNLSRPLPQIAANIVDWLVSNGEDHDTAKDSVKDILISILTELDKQDDQLPDRAQ